VAVLVVFLTMGVGSVSAAAVFNAGNGHYYELIIDDYITWVAARDAASATTMGGILCPGHLATITSSEENAFVTTQYPGYALSNKWLGGFQDPANESTRYDGWQWITGEPWVDTNWNSGEPNNNYYGCCGWESALTYWQNTLKWNDAPKLWIYGDGGYLIEWECSQILIDIKPGSYPNSINAGKQGTVPVAILGSADFDVTTIMASTIELDGVGVDMRGSAKAPKLAYSFEDVNSDGFMDLVAHFSVPMLQLTASETELSLTAILTNGANIIGSDSVHIVPA
jgi:hypothetical protein